MMKECYGYWGIRNNNPLYEDASVADSSDQ